MLQALDPDGEWTSRFKPLNINTDLHLPHHEDHNPRGENKRELSWIWQVLNSGDSWRHVVTEDKINDSKCCLLIYDL